MYKVTVPVMMTVCDFSDGTVGKIDLEKTLAEVKRGNIDRVAIAVERVDGLPQIPEKNMKLLKENLEFFKKNGVETMVWIGETMGHYGAPIEKPSGIFTNIMLDTGEYTRPYCPLDKEFQKMFAKWVYDIAKCGAKMIMLDDDYRLGYRFFDGFGCCCDLHMQRLREELGEDIKREELRKKIFLGGANKYRDAWLKVQGESMYELTRVLRAAADSVDPCIRMGFCACPNHWDSNGGDAGEITRIFAGKNKPFFRLTGAPYWVSQWGGFNPQTLGDIIEYTRMEKERHIKDSFELMAEGDTYPRPRFATPAAYLECFDMAIRADGEVSGILKYQMDYVSTPDYETGYIDASVNNQEIYKKIERMFDGKKAVGVRPYNAEHIMRDAVYTETDLENTMGMQNELLSASVKFATENSLPTSYKDGVNIIFGEHARHIPLCELKNGNIIDMKAAKILMERGVDVGIEIINDSDEYINIGLSDVPKELFVKEKELIRLSCCAKLENTSLKNGAEVISKMIAGKTEVNGIFLYENKSGERFIVLPFVGNDVVNTYGWMNNYLQRKYIFDKIEWLSGKPLSAYACGNYPRLYQMLKEDEKEIALGMWNTFADKINNVLVKLNVKAREVEYINCMGHEENGNIVLDSVLYPYEFAGILIRNFKKHDI